MAGTLGFEKVVSVVCWDCEFGADGETDLLPAIGILVCEWLGLNLASQVEKFGLIHQAKLFENDSHLGTHSVHQSSSGKAISC